jgi:RNA polymerase sigma-70 factor (ECF subfamily)
VDYARKHCAAKRGANRFTLRLDEAIAVPKKRELELVALDDALKGLDQLDPQQRRIVELRFFGGLTIDETSEVLGISPATVKRHWATARVWLHHEMNRTAQK